MIENLKPLVEATTKEKALENMHANLLNDKDKVESFYKDARLTESPEKRALNDMHSKIESVFPSRNMELAGEVHPVSGVPFHWTRIEVDGKEMKMSAPDFEKWKKYETSLPDELLKSNDPSQFKYCNQQLHNALERGEIDKNAFTKEQLDMIKENDTPKGFSWHHKEWPPGSMELVDMETHMKAGHTGGKEIWGGGKEFR